MQNNFIFKTPRLKAEVITELNKNHVFDLYNFKENIEFLQGIDAETDIKLSIECAKNYKNIGAYLIFENYTNKLVGVGGIQKQEPMLDASFAMPQHDIEFLIILNHGFKGQGYASEFCSAFFERLFVNFPNLEVPARVNKDNHSCIKLLKKLGFKEQGETHYNNYNNKFSLFTNSHDSWRQKIS
jgi:RimJ/RimL family protein N-acetyltransferase